MGPSDSVISAPAQRKTVTKAQAKTTEFLENFHSRVSTAIGSWTELDVKYLAPSPHPAQNIVRLEDVDNLYSWDQNLLRYYFSLLMNKDFVLTHSHQCPYFALVQVIKHIIWRPLFITIS